VEHRVATGATHIWGVGEAAPFLGGNLEETQNGYVLWIFGWRLFFDILLPILGLGGGMELGPTLSHIIFPLSSLHHLLIPH
jgi:hypothetical protein